MKIKLHLEDRGQDFTWFIIEGDKIVEAGPFQNWLWAGKKIKPPKKWKKDAAIVFADGGQLHYRVTRVEQNAVIGAQMGILAKKQTNNTTSKRLAQIMRDHFGIKKCDCRPSTTLGDLNADSLDQIELLITAEAEFGIDISDKDAEKIKTFGDAVDLVNALLKR